MDYKYNDGMASGNRRPRLYLYSQKSNEVIEFVGKTIPGFVFVEKAIFSKNGTWSNTDYILKFCKGIKPLYFLSPLHGIWGQNYSSWGELIEDLGIPIEIAKEIIGKEYPATKQRLNDMDDYLAMEGEDSSVEFCTISFGGPTNRDIDAGYWTNSKIGSVGEFEIEIAPGSDGWYNPKVISPVGAKIISSTKSPGHHGGYWCVRVAVIIENKK